MWNKIEDKMLPACTYVLVRRMRKTGITSNVYRAALEVYFVSTRPAECAEDGKITHWMFIPPVGE